MSSHKTIAKNSLFLYFRMFITMAVGLYTSRLVLEALGVVDYGLYGLVGGIVSMFAFLNSSMSAATQRYLSFDIGKGDEEQLQKTFNASLNIHILIGVVIVVLAETVGLWFVNAKLDIPADRLSAANWVYQFSILAFFYQVIQVPYNALLIARERMGIYAYMSIVEVVLKLIIVFVLLAYDKDRLILYAILTFAVSFVVRMLYKWYCKRNFKEAVYKFYYDKKYYSELLSFSGWNLFGSFAVVTKWQGVNILLNIFFGPVLNSAHSITMQVQGAISAFVQNFQIAIKPQIISLYATNDKKASNKIITIGSKFSFLLMYLLVVPVAYNIEFILSVWLKTVPEYTADFIVLSLIAVMIDSISEPIVNGIQASGKIRNYQIILSSILIVNLPLIYLLYSFGYSPKLGYMVFIVTNTLAMLYRLKTCNKLTGLDIKVFFKTVIGRSILLVLLTLTTSYFILTKIEIDNEWLFFLISALVITIVNLVVVFVFFLEKVEKEWVYRMIKEKLQ